VRGGFNRAFFGDEVYGAFEKTKQLFDPVGLMNPGKVTGTPPMTSNLRYADDYKPQSNVGRYRYPQEGSLLAAAEKCSGLGACRKTLEGTMCPSYMATRDELHSTRGRANALRLALSGQLEGEGLGSPVLAQAMDLCLACTACKAECPNGVDMARLKAETLQAHHDLYKPNPRTLIFAALPKIAEFAAGPQAPIVNALVRNPLLKKLRHHLLGITSERDLPAFTSHRLSEWFYHRSASTSRQSKVIFLNETYTEHFLPEIGRAAIECLEAGGVGVSLATVTHAPRMAISQGLLDRAKIEGQNLLRTLDQMGQGADPILVCEPSTATAIIQDLPDLVEDPEMARRVAKRIIMWDKYMEENTASGIIDLIFKPIRDNLHFLIHPHCHQRQLDGGVFSKRLLERVPNSFVTDTNSGCCGMAGTFGYEVEHVAVSHKVASHRLIPTLTQNENNERIIVANGFSCRHQISDLVPENPLHIAEVIRLSVLQES
jgi:Fe-S oxidoreductase